MWALLSFVRNGVRKHAGAGAGEVDPRRPVAPAPLSGRAMACAYLRFFLISCRVLPRRGILSAAELAGLAPAIHERREEHQFLLTAGVFLPDHGQAIFYPPSLLTFSRVMEAIQDGAMKRINRRRRERGTWFPPRFFDRA